MHAVGPNALAGGFNAALGSLLAGLPRRLSYSLGDLSGLMQAATAEPPRAAAGGGPWNVDSACCGGGRMPAQLDAVRGPRALPVLGLVGPPQLIAAALYDGPPEFTAPVNLKQLII